MGRRFWILEICCRRFIEELVRLPLISWVVRSASTSPFSVIWSTINVKLRPAIRLNFWSWILTWAVVLSDRFKPFSAWADRLIWKSLPLSERSLILNSIWSNWTGTGVSGEYCKVPFARLMESMGRFVSLILPPNNANQLNVTSNLGIFPAILCPSEKLMLSTVTPNFGKTLSTILPSMDKVMPFCLAAFSISDL